MRRTWTNHDVAKLRAMRDAGKPASEIGNVFSISRGEVSRAAKRFGLPPIRPQVIEEYRTFAEWAALDAAKIKTVRVPILGRTSIIEIPSAMMSVGDRPCDTEPAE